MNPENWDVRWFGLERELARVESPQLRKEIWLKASARLQTWPRAGIVVVVLIDLLFFVVAPLSLTLQNWNRDRNSAMFYAGFGILGTCVAVLPFLFRRRTMRLALREQLRAHGIPACLHCGYNLTGIAGNRCPECGKTAD